jgi:hypothetical protein
MISGANFLEAFICTASTMLGKLRLPLFYVIEGLNEVMIYDNVGDALIDLAIVAVLAVAMTFAAVRLFKWHEELSLGAVSQLWPFASRPSNTAFATFMALSAAGKPA